MKKKSIKIKILDPMSPSRFETTFYVTDPEFAINLYSVRLRVSRVTAEDNIRKHLLDLGFKDISKVYIPREN